MQFPECVFPGREAQTRIHQLSSARPGRALQPDATPTSCVILGALGGAAPRHQPTRIMHKTDGKPTFLLRTLLVSLPHFSIDTIARGGAQPLKFKSRPGAVRFSVGLGLLPGDPVLRPDRPAQMAVTLLLRISLGSRSQLYA